MKYSQVKTYLDAISSSNPQTFKELSIKLNISESSVITAFRFINKRKVMKFPPLKIIKFGDQFGIIKHDNTQTLERLKSYFKKKELTRKQRERRKERILNDNRQSFEKIEEYHKNKTCIKCKSKLELSRWRHCLKCKPTLRDVPQEFIENGW
jgi:hypothetical protein